VALLDRRSCDQAPSIAAQQQLADASGLDIRYIGSIERGQRNPTFGVLQGIASVFGMKTSDLLRKAKL